MEKKFENPPVSVSVSGVHSVKVSDIFRSTAGQTIIRQMASLQLEPQKVRDDK